MTEQRPFSLGEVAYLHFNVQQHDAALFRLLLNRHLAGAVAVAAKLGVLDEAVLGDEVLKVLHRHKVVVLAVLLARPRGAGGVRDGQAKGVRVALKEEVVEGALADAGRAGDDDGTAIYLGSRKQCQRSVGTC